MSADARLVLRHDPGKVALLQQGTATTIGRAEGNRLRLSTIAGVSDHHAVVRFSRSQGWLVCEWQSLDGTFLEGERIRQCRRLHDGDEIQLGASGPVLVFQLLRSEATAGATGSGAAGTAAVGASRPNQSATPPRAAGGAASRSDATAASPPARVAGTGSPAGGGTRAAAGAGASTPQPRRAASPTPRPQPGAASLNLAGRSIPLDRILSAHVRSRPRFPHSFSWWALVCLGGMVLLPFAWLFWCIQIAALAGWIVLGSRKQHELVITLRDGMAHRHHFANRITALSHRNGIRKAIGQSSDNG